jgi:hypothetical protein
MNLVQWLRERRQHDDAQRLARYNAELVSLQVVRALQVKHTRKHLRLVSRRY